MAKSKHAQRMRLTDIETLEVSMVGKAANKRQWVLRKDADGMKVKLKPDGKGGFVTDETSAEVTPGAAPAEVPAAVGISKGTKVALLTVVESLTALTNGPEAETDSEELGVAISKALEGFEPEPEETPELVKLAKAAVGSPEEKALLVKAATGCGMKLLEIAQGLNLTADVSEASNCAYGLKWKISSVLDALCALAELESAQPGAAAVVAASVGSVAKSDNTDSSTQPGAAKLNKLVCGLQKALYSNVDTSDDTSVTTATFDIEKTGELLGAAKAEILKLRARISEIEALPAPSNSLPVEGTPVQKSASPVWPRDMNDEG